MTQVAVLDKEMRRRVAEAPESPRALLDLGQHAFQRGRHDPAVWFTRSLALAPDEPGLHLALSIVLHGRAARLQSLRRALALDPSYANAWLALAEESDDPVSALRRAWSIDAEDPNVGSTLVARLIEDDKAREAERIAERLCRVRPEHAPAWINFGRTAVETGAWDKGLVYMRRGVALAPGSFEGWMNLGSIAGELMQSAVAATAGRAVALNPNHPQARWNKTLALLTEGDWRRGFADFEVRHAIQQTYPHALSGRPWRGERFTGRLLIHDEIGYGDVFNFLRYLRLAKERVEMVILEVKPGLGRLLSGYPAADRVLERKAGPPPADSYDAYVALESLPGLFGTTLEETPGPEPRLWPDPALVEDWRKRLSSLRRPVVGLCWAGNPASAFDRKRSCRLADLAPLIAVDGISFVSLQKGAAAAETEGRVVPLADELGDFADTAAVIANLDLVISVETSVAHLAGAMHAPTWIMLSVNPAWRWPRVGDRTAWYPSAELFRVGDGGWEALARTLARQLRQRF